MSQAPQMSEFQDRIKRINNPRNTSYFDREMQMNIPKRVSKNYINRKKKPQVAMSALAISLVVGMAAYLAVQVASGRFGLLPPAQIVQFGVAAIVAIILGTLMRHKTMAHMGAQIAGVVLMIACAHNVVWLFPQATSQVMSQAYVNQVQATTQPYSVSLLGNTYTL